MVLSTTGFGPTAKMQTFKRDEEQPVDSVDDATSVSSIAQAQPATAQAQDSRMPYPRFDLDLSDLFADDEPQLARPSMNIPLVMQRQLQQQQAIARQSTSDPAQAFSTTLKQEEPLSATAGVSNLQLSSPTVSEAGGPHQVSPNFTLASDISTQMPYNNTFPPSIQSTYPDIPTFSDLDWLDAFPPGSSVGASAAANTDYVASGGTENTDLGLGDLGLAFGMGWDGGGGNTDDLFDGFFFGSGVGGGTTGM